MVLVLARGRSSAKLLAVRTSRPAVWLHSLGQFLAGLVSDAVGAYTRWSRRKQFLVAGAVVVFVAVTALIDVPSLVTLRSWAEAAGPWFVFVYWLGYVAITQFPVPRTVLTLSAGVLFGPWEGLLLALTATTVSAAVSLVIVRRLLGEWMRPRLRHPAVVGIDTRLRQRGWLAVTSLRMIAGVPFSVLNYVAALTSVPLASFTSATLLGSAPGTVVTVFLGDALTGQPDLTLIWVTVGLAVLGVLGLVLDSRVPVKPRK